MILKFIKKLIGFNKEKTVDYLKNSQILEHIEYERIVYLALFEKELQSLEHRNIDYKTEAPITIEGINNAVFRQMRVDMLIEEDGEPNRHEETNIANPPYFKEISEDWDDINITLKPFVWNAVQFNVKSEFPDIKQLENWHHKWFDSKGRHKANAQHLHQVIHKMSEPVAIEDGWSIVIDFGSAEIDAFLAFIKQCRFNWATDIEISSDEYLNRLSKAYNLNNNSSNAEIITTTQPT